MQGQALPGFRDFYPDELALRNHIFATWREVARRYGFQEYDGPPLEPLELYTDKSGEEIVQQLYAFEDKGGRKPRRSRSRSAGSRSRSCSATNGSSGDGCGSTFSSTWTSSAKRARSPTRSSSRPRSTSCAPSGWGRATCRSGCPIAACCAPCCSGGG